MTNSCICSLVQSSIQTNSVISKSVAEMQALKASDGFIKGQLYQIYNAHSATQISPFTLTPIGTLTLVEVVPFYVRGETSNAQATVTNFASAPIAVITPISGVFLNGEVVVSPVTGNRYTLSSSLISKGAVINVRAYSTNQLEAEGFGSFKNLAMTDAIFAKMWYDLDLDLVYRVVTKQDAVAGSGASDVQDVLSATSIVDTAIFDHLYGVSNTGYAQRIAVRNNILGSAAATTAITSSNTIYGNGIDLSNSIITHFIVRWNLGTFGAVVVKFKINGVEIKIPDSTTGIPSSSVTLTGIDATNNIVVPVSLVSLMKQGAATTLEVQVTGTVAGTQFGVECYGYKIL